MWKATKFNVTPEITRFKVKIEKLSYIGELCLNLQKESPGGVL